MRPEQRDSERAESAEEVIRLEGIAKSFGAVTAVHPTSFSVRRGEFFALLGPSGCGKTTLLRILSGFHPPTAGRLFIDGTDMTAVPANRRPVNMVFQSYAVFPHMSVGDNVAYGLKVAKVARSERKQRVREALELVRLGGMESRRPAQLSGGQQQRVALARALVMQPKVLLLDEPLSALDAKLREHMCAELVRLQKQVGITFLIVTHDQAEALSMADRIAVMNHGHLEQLDSPETLYTFPATRFVADFIGRINFFAAEILADGTVEAQALGKFRPTQDSLPQGAATAALRPEQIVVSTTAPPKQEGRSMARGTVSLLAYYGDYCTAEIVLEGKEGGREGESEGGTEGESEDSPKDNTGGQAKMTVFIINNTPQAREIAREGQAVWCSWAIRDLLLIPQAGGD